MEEGELHLPTGGYRKSKRANYSRKWIDWRKYWRITNERWRYHSRQETIWINPTYIWRRNQTQFPHPQRSSSSHIAGQNSAASFIKACEWHSSHLPLLSTPPSMSQLHHCPLFYPFLPCLFKPQTSLPIVLALFHTPEERGSEKTHQDFSPFSVLFAFVGINYLTISIHQRQNPNKRKTLKFRTW